MCKKYDNYKAKLVLKALKNGSYICEVLKDNELEVDDLKFWRKTNRSFDESYLKAIGITRLQERFVEVFPNKLLNVAATCRAVHIHRSTYYRWIDKCDTFRLVLHDASEGLKDDIEAIIIRKALIDKDLQFLLLLAKAKMKDRGW
jgi:transposase-like protein